MGAGETAFLAAYAPAKRDAIDATRTLLRKLEADPAALADAKLKHAIELAEKATKVEGHFAGQQAAAAIAKAGSDESATTIGKLAYDLMLAWRRAERLAHLRTAAPTQALLAAEATQRTRETAAAWTALEAAMRGDRRLRVRHQKLTKWLTYAPAADATSSVLFDSAVQEITKWLAYMELQFGAMARDLDTPASATPAASDILAALGISEARPLTGAPTEITIDLDSLVKNAAAIFAAAPITAVHLRGGVGGRGAALAGVRELERLSYLGLVEQGITDADLRAILAARWPALRSLDLTQNEITDAGVDALAAASKALPRLEAVSLQLNRATDPVDERVFTDETTSHREPTARGKALEAAHGPLRWLHPT
jgi:hypothetical protein